MYGIAPFQPKVWWWAQFLSLSPLPFRRVERLNLSVAGGGGAPVHPVHVVVVGLAHEVVAWNSIYVEVGLGLNNSPTASIRSMGVHHYPSLMFSLPLSYEYIRTQIIRIYLMLSCHLRKNHSPMLLKFLMVALLYYRHPELH